jgi:hypothetical protein
VTQFNRRLSDKILPAFHQACDQAEIETAEYLLLALEMANSRNHAQPDLDKLRSVAPALGAYQRLDAVRRPQLSLGAGD